jgi:hypothetical protein
MTKCAVPVLDTADREMAGLNTGAEVGIRSDHTGVEIA